MVRYIKSSPNLFHGFVRSHIYKSSQHLSGVTAKVEDVSDLNYRTITTWHRTVFFVLGTAKRVMFQVVFTKKIALITLFHPTHHLMPQSLTLYTGQVCMVGSTEVVCLVSRRLQQVTPRDKCTHVDVVRENVMPDQLTKQQDQIAEGQFILHISILIWYNNNNNNKK